MGVVDVLDVEHVKLNPYLLSCSLFFLFSHPYDSLFPLIFLSLIDILTFLLIFLLISFATSFFIPNPTGGQGTRLGSDLPKGCFFIGLPSGKSLFQLQAERIKRLIHLAAEVSGKSTDSIHLPWYIMTSKATHEATISYFEQVHFFQLPRDDIYFFQQRELPAIRLDGKIIMESKYQMALSPNGNGGIFDALVQHGILANMKQRGLKHCHIYGVDNVLVKVADPTLIGFASDKNIQCVNKVVLKEDPSEKVGVMAVKNERCTIVEYSELSEAMASLRNPNGELTYNAGNIVQHYFSVDFLQTIVGNQLEYHLATKAIPLINEEGNVIAPSTPNGTKLEMFIFDIFERISLTQIAAFVVNRVEEFAAVKNKSGVDSPETARTLLSNYHKVLATTAGARFHDHEPSSLFEISPLVSYAGEDLEKLCRGQSFQLPCNLESNASI